MLGERSRSRARCAVRCRPMFAVCATEKVSAWCLLTEGCMVLRRVLRHESAGSNFGASAGPELVAASGCRFMIGVARVQSARRRAGAGHRGRGAGEWVGTECRCPSRSLSPPAWEWPVRYAQTRLAIGAGAEVPSPCVARAREVSSSSWGCKSANAHRAHDYKS